MARRAVILAGGLGSRLRPYTVVLPKPLMPVGEMPILEILVQQLAAAGFSRLTLAVNHQADIIRAYFADGAKWGIAIDYSLEDRPLSTMAPLRLIKDLPEHFLVANGDLLTDLNFARFHDEHLRADRLFTVSAYQRELRSEFGILEVDGQGFLSSFQEKPLHCFLVSMGVYMVKRTVVDLIPADQPYGFDHLMLAMIARGTPAAVRQHQGYWLDIGRPDDYLRAIEEFPHWKERLLP